MAPILPQTALQAAPDHTLPAPLPKVVSLLLQQGFQARQGAKTIPILVVLLLLLLLALLLLLLLLLLLPWSLLPSLVALHQEADPLVQSTIHLQLLSSPLQPI